MNQPPPPLPADEWWLGPPIQPAFPSSWETSSVAPPLPHTTNPNLPQQHTPPALGQENINYDPIELAYYEQTFRILDPANQGVVQASAASDFFRKSGLADSVLEQIWNLANANGANGLDPPGFYVGCRLIAHAQNGVLPTPEAMHQVPVSVPYFQMAEDEMIHNLSMAPPIDEQTADPFSAYQSQASHFLPPDPHLLTAAAPLSAAVPGGAMIPQPPPPVAAPSYMPDFSLRGFPGNADDGLFTDWFYQLGPNEMGVIPASTAKPFLEKSGLSDLELYEIWEMTDADKDGALSLSEFIAACQVVSDRVQHQQQEQPKPEAALQSQEQIQSPAALDPLGKTNGPETDWLTAPSILKSPEDAAASAPAKLSDETENAGAQDIWAVDDKPNKGKEADVFDFPEGTKTESESEGELKGSRRKKKNGKKISGKLVTFDSKVSVAFDLQDVCSKNGQIEEGEAKGLIHRSSKLREERRRNKLDYFSDLDSEKETLEGLLRAIKRDLQRGTDLDFEDIEQLVHLTSLLRNETKDSLEEVRKLGVRREELQRELEQLRLEYEVIKEERRLLDIERVSKKKDCDTISELILVYNKEIEETNKDIKKLTESNSWLKSVHVAGTQQMAALDEARRSVASELQMEQTKINSMVQEVNNLRTTVDKLRREKEQLEAENAIATHLTKEVQQDRFLMISNLEADRTALQALRKKRMELNNEQSDLICSASTLKDRWKSSERTNGMVHGGPTPQLDKKGVPNAVGLSPVKDANILDINQNDLPTAGSGALTTCKNDRRRGAWETFH